MDAKINTALTYEDLLREMLWGFKDKFGTIPVDTKGKIPDLLYDNADKVVRDNVAFDILKWGQEWDTPEVKEFAFVVSRRIRKILVAE